MSKQKSYDAVFKLKAIEVAEKKCKEAMARKFKVDLKRIREWCKKKKEVNEFTKAKTSMRKHLLVLGSRGKKVNNKEMEDALFSRIADMQQQILCVSCNMKAKSW